MESGFMSIKNPNNNINIYLVIKFFYIVIFILITLNSVCFCWYAENKSRDISFFDCRNNEPCSDKYVIYENSKNGKCDLLLPGSLNKVPFAASAAIDIPLSQISKESVEPSKYLDRLIAVNLRIKNLLEEYENLRKKSDSFNKLNNPSFTEKTSFNSLSQANIKKKEIYSLRQKIGENLSDVITYSPKSELASAPLFNKDMSGGSMTGITSDNSVLANKKQNDTVYTYHEVNMESGFKSNSELPWIFKFFIGSFKFLINNKYEILLFLLFLVISVVMLIGRSRK